MLRADAKCFVPRVEREFPSIGSPLTTSEFAALAAQARGQNGSKQSTAALIAKTIADREYQAKHNNKPADNLPSGFVRLGMAPSKTCIDDNDKEEEQNRNCSPIVEDDPLVRSSSFATRVTSKKYGQKWEALAHEQQEAIQAFIATHTRSAKNVVGAIRGNQGPMGGVFGQTHVWHHIFNKDLIDVTNNALIGNSQDKEKEEKRKMMMKESSIASADEYSAEQSWLSHLCPHCATTFSSITNKNNYSRDAAVAALSLLYHLSSQGCSLCLTHILPLLPSGINLDLKNKGDRRNALFYAVSSTASNVATVQLLVNRGCSVDNNNRDKRGWTLLHAAVNADNVEIVMFLLNHGLKINIRSKDNNSTPLHFVKSRAMALMLLQYGGNPYLCNNKGMTIIDISAARGYVGVLQCVLKANHGHYHSQTPLEGPFRGSSKARGSGRDLPRSIETGAQAGRALQLAIRYGHKDCVRVLCRHFHHVISSANIKCSMSLFYAVMRDPSIHENFHYNDDIKSNLPFVCNADREKENGHDEVMDILKQHEEYLAIEYISSNSNDDTKINDDDPMILELLSAGYDPYFEDSSGCIPLVIAALLGASRSFFTLATYMNRSDTKGLYNGNTHNSILGFRNNHYESILDTYIRIRLDQQTSHIDSDDDNNNNNNNNNNNTVRDYKVIAALLLSDTNLPGLIDLICVGAPLSQHTLSKFVRPTYMGILYDDQEMEGEVGGHCMIYPSNQQDHQHTDISHSDCYCRLHFSASNINIPISYDTLVCIPKLMAMANFKKRHQLSTNNDNQQFVIEMDIDPEMLTLIIYWVHNHKLMNVASISTEQLLLLVQLSDEYVLPSLVSYIENQLIHRLDIGNATILHSITCHPIYEHLLLKLKIKASLCILESASMNWDHSSLDEQRRVKQWVHISLCTLMT